MSASFMAFFASKKHLRVSAMSGIVFVSDGTSDFLSRGVVSYLVLVIFHQLPCAVPDINTYRIMRFDRRSLRDCNALSTNHARMASYVLSRGTQADSAGSETTTTYLTGVSGHAL